MILKILQVKSETCIRNDIQSYESLAILKLNANTS